MLELLSSVVKGRLNILVSGGVGAGKTTLLNVLSGYILNSDRWDRPRVQQSQVGGVVLGLLRDHPRIYLACDSYFQGGNRRLHVQYAFVDAVHHFCQLDEQFFKVIGVIGARELYLP